jgi:hypothetical protein
VYDITEALSKKADIIFMYLTFSSLAIGFAKYTFEKNMSFPLLKALRESISICDKNAMKQTIETIPVVVFTTLIDAVSWDYKIFSLMVPYPVKMNKMNQVEADSEKLLIKLDKDSHRSEYLKI